jgi:hypothetical protein
MDRLNERLHQQEEELAEARQRAEEVHGHAMRSEQTVNRR